MDFFKVRPIDVTKKKKRITILVLPKLRIFKTRFGVTYFLSLEWIILFSVVKLDNVLSLS